MPFRWPAADDLAYILADGVHTARLSKLLYKKIEKSGYHQWWTAVQVETASGAVSPIVDAKDKRSGVWRELDLKDLDLSKGGKWGLQRNGSTIKNLWF